MLHPFEVSDAQYCISHIFFYFSLSFSVIDKHIELNHGLFLLVPKCSKKNGQVHVKNYVGT